MSRGLGTVRWPIFNLGINKTRAARVNTPRPEVRRTWTTNTELAKRPSQFFRSLYRQLADQAPTQYRPLFFRWFVGGDCPSKKFATDVVSTAFSFPTIRFLCFTKRYKWFNEILDTTRRPENLALIYSAWPKLDLPNPHSLPVAWMDDGTDDRIPADAMHCGGCCETCGKCWVINDIKKDVVFTKH